MLTSEVSFSILRCLSSFTLQYWVFRLIRLPFYFMLRYNNGYMKWEGGIDMSRPYTGKHSFRIIEREKNGTIYVYEQESWYDQSTKNTKYKHVLEGIRDPQTGEIKPTRPKSKKKTPSEVPVTVEIAFNAMLEIIKIAKACGVNNTETMIEEAFESFDKMIPEGKTSMLQDVESGRKTEAQMFSTTIIELGKKYNIPTPYNEFLKQMLDIIDYNK